MLKSCGIELQAFGRSLSKQSCTHLSQDHVVLAEVTATKTLLLRQHPSAQTLAWQLSCRANQHFVSCAGQAVAMLRR